MSSFKIETDPAVPLKFKSYSPTIRKRLKALRKLVLDTAKEDSGITELTETLKWGEPSYLVKKGSTIRMDWKSKSPDQYAIYFKCTSKLVTTFKEIYGDKFKYEKTRAILFSLDDVVPEKELKQCIAMALNYHSLKNKPQLGYAKT